MAFLDLEKAFDCVPHQLIWYALRDHLNHLLTGWVYQGSALSPLLFIMVMDTIMHDLHQNTSWTMFYVDDVVLTSTTKGKLHQQVQTWNDHLNHFGFCLNIKKTEYLENTWNTSNQWRKPKEG
ncbi:hypothetical protein E2320_015593 [Naja naja]|nr:hypothetical protein E2320_015593 [Naja naja]